MQIVLDKCWFYLWMEKPPKPMCKSKRTLKPDNLLCSKLLSSISTDWWWVFLHWREEMLAQLSLQNYFKSDTVEDFQPATDFSSHLNSDFEFASSKSSLCFGFIESFRFADENHSPVKYVVSSMYLALEEANYWNFPQKLFGIFAILTKVCSAVWTYEKYTSLHCSEYLVGSDRIWFAL